MNRMSRLVVKENFDDDDLSDDVEDEVFVRDGKCKSNFEKKIKSDQQPLMPMRKKQKQRSVLDNSSKKSCNIYRHCLLPIYFGAAAILLIAILILFFILAVNRIPILAVKFGFLPYSNNGINKTIDSIMPCNDFQLTKTWSQKIPRLMSQSQIRLIDIDQDGIDDVVIGTGTDRFDIMSLDRTCLHEYLHNSRECLGGVIALNGKTGSMLWRTWLRQTVSSVHCDFDITNDTVQDCVITGKEGLLLAINSIDGTILWDRKPITEMELYSVLIIRDVNNDGYLDLLSSHYSRNTTENDGQSHILIIDGKTGRTLHTLKIANEPILLAPQMVIDPDGGEYVMFVTGDMESDGGLYIVSLYSLLNNESYQIQILYKTKPGILASPTLVDLNVDRIPDVVFTTSSEVIALNGYDFSTIWNVTLHNIVITPYPIIAASSVTPAYFNEDEVPDLLLTYSVGISYFENFYSVMLILNGKNGKPLSGEPIIKSGSSDTAGGISLSLEGSGNDAFLYWMSMCKDDRKAISAFKFSPNGKISKLADLCLLRFNSTSQIQLYALNRHVQPPGVILKTESWNESWDYKTADLTEEEIRAFSKTTNPQMTNRKFPSPNDPTSEVLHDPEKKKNWPTHFKHKKVPMIGPSKLPENQNVDAWMDGAYIQPPEQMPNDYWAENIVDDRMGIDDDATMTAENEFIVPTKRKFKRDVNTDPLSPVNDNMLPQVAATGVLTRSFEDPNGVDIIIMHYDIKADDNICIDSEIDKNRRCTNQRSENFDPSTNDNNNILGTQFLNRMPYVAGNTLLFNRKKLTAIDNTADNSMSNLYISRHRVTCRCLTLLNMLNHNQTCSKILPFEKQSYPAYMGRMRNSVFKARYF